jgi:hypothetical protein
VSATAAADLILKLYELRTEPTLRAARAWFGFEFHPRTAQDVLYTWLGPGHSSAPYRMVTTYWDMAASLVVQQAIPVEMFNAANTEHFAVYAKLKPFLAEVRVAATSRDYLTNIERVVTAGPDAQRRIETFERYVERQRKFADEGKQRSGGSVTPGASA